MANEYWLSDEQWGAIEPLIPTGRRGVRPQRNREVISGILHVLKFGCRWRDCPQVYGPHTTIYNRFNRWSKAGIWQAIVVPSGDDGAGGSAVHRQHDRQIAAVLAAKGGLKYRLSAVAAGAERPKSMPLPTAPGV
jgi:transposase